MLMRFDPFRDLERWSEQLSNASRSAIMPLDAYRHGDRYVVHLDLPGVDPSSIDVTVEKNVLTVKAERSWQPTNGEQVLVSERPQGVFSRQLFLGEGVDTDKIDATYEAGVLTVTLPVAEAAKPRRVQIATGSPDGSRQAIEAQSTRA